MTASLEIKLKRKLVRSLQRRKNLTSKIRNIIYNTCEITLWFRFQTGFYKSIIEFYTFSHFLTDRIISTVRGGCDWVKEIFVILHYTQFSNFTWFLIVFLYHDQSIKIKKNIDDSKCIAIYFQSIYLNKMKLDSSQKLSAIHLRG